MQFYETFLKDKIRKNNRNSYFGNEHFRFLTLHAAKIFILLCTMITMVTQGAMSPLYKFPSREYSFRSAVILVRIVCVNANAREFSRLFLSTLPLNGAVRRRR